jgi:hypothetical protein
VGKLRSDQAFNGRIFLDQPIFDEMALKICERSLKQPSITRDVVAMRMQTGGLFINHRGLSACVKEMYVQGKNCRRRSISV